MRSYVPAYDLRTVRDLREALQLLSDGFRPIAGGTDVMVLFEAGKLAHTKWADIRGLTGLRGIETDPDRVTIGALTTYTDVRRSAILAAEFPMLCDAAAQTGGIATQNRGTMGGNIVNASPAADTPPALLAYDAQIELTSSRGPRWIAYSQFHKGYKLMDLAPDELLTRVRLPRRFAQWMHFYRKVGTRRAQAISKVCFAGVRRGNEMRIGLGSVAPAPLLIQRDTLDQTPLFLEQIAPIDDIRSTARYRTQVVKNLLDQFLGRA
jgi:CO/xanthine dehydrogenase FAD-binding subunit